MICLVSNFTAETTNINELILFSFSGLPIRNGDNHAVEVTNCAMDLLSHVMQFKVAHLDDYVLRIRIGKYKFRILML